MAPQTAHEKLQTTLELLNKRSDHLQTLANQETVKAKALAPKNQQMAMRCLRRRKAYENQIKQLDNQILALEQQMMTLEDVKTTASIVSTMKMSSQVLKQSIMEKDLDVIMEVTEQYDDARERINEFNAMLERQAVGANVDDDELQRELEELEQEHLNESLAKVEASIPILPTAPKTVVKPEPKPAVEDEDEELARQLRDWSRG